MLAGLARPIAELSAADLLRLQALDGPPRGLVLVVGCIGVVLGLADAIPSWDGCRELLKGKSLRRTARFATRRRQTPALGAVVHQSASFLQALRSFDAEAVAAVTSDQRQAVLEAVRGDVGGLMQPHHLEQVSRGAAALGSWILSVHALLRAPPPPPPPPSALFAGPETTQCPVCGARLQLAALTEHAALCAARRAEGEARQALLARTPRERSSAQSARGVSAGRVGVGLGGLSPMAETVHDRERTAALVAERVPALRLSELQHAPLPSLSARLTPAPVPASPTVEPPPAPTPPLRRADPIPVAPPSPPAAAVVPPPGADDARAVEATRDPGFDYLRARTGHLAQQLEAALRDDTAIRSDAAARRRAQVPRGGATSIVGRARPSAYDEWMADARGGAGTSSARPLNGRRAQGKALARSPSRSEAAAAATGNESDEDGTSAVVLSRHALVQEVRRNLARAGALSAEGEHPRGSRAHVMGAPSMGAPAGFGQALLAQPSKV